jgi:hypothetical protein
MMPATIPPASGARREMLIVTTDAREPRQLARRLVRSEPDDAQHVQRGYHDDEARAEVVKAANEPSGPRAADEEHAFVRVIGRRRVVQRQEGTGDQLHAEQREQHAAQREEPSGPGRQRVIEQHLASGAQPDP